MARYHGGMAITNLFTPLSVRRGKRSKEFLDLEEGVPDYLFPHLRDWLYQTSLFGWNVTVGGRVPYLAQPGQEMLLIFKLTCHANEEFWNQLWRERDLFLDVIDYTLAASALEPSSVFNVDASSLERLLQKGRSTLMVAPSGRSLIERLSSESQDALEKATSSGDAAADHLAEAWQNAWSRTPNAISSYQSGIMAIESAMRSIVSPNNSRATLGTMISEVRHKPSKWRTRFDGPDSIGIEALVQMLEVIWQAHTRHGSDQYASVTLEQARDVCQIALLVVSLANSRGIARVGG